MAIPMIGVGALEAEGDEHGAQDDAEGDEAVDARVVAVGDERGAVKAAAGAQPDLRGHLVTQKADRPGRGEPAEVRELVGVDEPFDRLVECDAGTHEYGEDDEVAGDLFAAGAAQEERDAERYGRQGVARVVDEVGEQRDAAASGEDDRLECCGEPEHAEADGNRLHSRVTADDRAVDEPVAVPMVMRHAISLH